MIITIDKSGRILLPQRLLDVLHLAPGNQLEVQVKGASLRMTPVSENGAFFDKNGFLVHHGDGDSDLDIAKFIRTERDRRSLGGS